MSDLNTLVKQRGQIKSQLTRFKNHVDNIDVGNLDDATLINLECRYSKFVTLWDSFCNIQSEIELKGDDDNGDSERDSFETNYFETETAVKCILNKRYAASNSELGTNNTNTGNNDLSPPDNEGNVRLPVIPLPVFKGTYEGWNSFKNTFNSLITSNQKLSKVQKYYYLKSSLQGDAAYITENLEINEASFDTAWKLLKDRFENKRRIVYTYIQALLVIPSANKESITHLRTLQETIIKNVQSLKHMGIDTDAWDVLITHILSNKFDPVTRKEWEKYPLAEELPTLDELLQFIAEKCTTLETLDAHKSENKNNAVSNDRRRTNVNVAVTQTSCSFCKQSHLIYNCTAFKNLPVNQRIEEIKKLGLCLNCLKGKHIAAQCRHTNCRQCNKKHNTLLHLISINTNSAAMVPTNRATEQQNIGENSQNVISNAAVTSLPEVILSTAIVNIYDKDGNAHKCKCLLDTGSQSSFIREDVVNMLKISTTPFRTSVVGITEVCSEVRAKVLVKISSTHHQFSSTLSCLVLPRITDDLPSISKVVNISDSIKLADPEFRKGGRIQLLIGTDLFWSLLLPRQINLGQNYPILQESRLGWIIAGPVQNIKYKSQRLLSNASTISNTDLNKSLTKFWEIEDEQYIKHYSTEELQCETHFQETHKRDKDGRFVVRLPFNEKITQLGESRQSALNRFHALERRLNKNPMLKQQYVEFMQEYERLNHMRKTNDDMSLKERQYYIPHHAVFKDQKIRVVFDASNKSNSGLSLNDTLLTGPAIHNDLFDILVNFRKHDYVLGCDIVKMFRQILIDENDRCYQKILWRYDSTSPIETYELNTVVFGMTSSPFLAMRCVQEIANTIEKNADNLVNVAHIMKNQIYVDDILCGANSIKELLQIKSDLIKALNSAGFELSKFNTNILNERLDGQDDIVKINSYQGSKTLGVHWNSQQDTINYSFNFMQNQNITKRSVLSEIAQLWDPLGILGPVIVNAKIFIQKLWLERLQWDETLPVNFANQWVQFRNSLPKLNEVCIPRHILCKQATYVEIHGFADASNQAYGACIYVKSKNELKDVVVRLLCAKSKVAPVKLVSLPRLELCAAVLLSKLLQSVKRSLGQEINKFFLWSDSTITLHWIQASPHRWKTYVAHRTTVIQNITNKDDWRYVKSKENPADLISRGLTPNDLLSSSLWLNGPQWLKQDENKWPKDIIRINPDIEIPEARTISNATFIQNNYLLQIIERYSDLYKLQSVVAYVLRFINNLKTKREGRIVGRLNIMELNQALNVMIRLSQIQYFPKEYSNLKLDKPIQKSSNLLHLNPFLDSERLIRVGGRLSNSNLSYDNKYPILLPKKHSLTKLIVRDLHIRSAHCGPQLLLSTVRQRFWPISGMSLAKEITRKCITCFKAKPRGHQYIMGNLPADRITPGKPFGVTGTDFCGPFLIKERTKRNRAFIKVYICVFVCLSTRACHLEIVGDLTTDSFLAAFKRFVSRRGKCTKIYSDNGTNYVGAYRQLKELYDFIGKNENTLHQNMLKMGLTWVFSPARTPHFGGIFEACVKSTKFHLHRIIGETKLTYEEFFTITTQVEACLNSRPISPLSNDPNDPSPLTPGHFLTGGPLTAIPEPNFLEYKDNILSRWQLVQKITQDFWKRWSKEYIHHLQSRSKWAINRPNEINIGDLVIIKGESNNPLQWPTGRVVQCHSGSDGVTRVLSVRTLQGVIKRGITKVFKLPID